MHHLGCETPVDGRRRPEPHRRIHVVDPQLRRAGGHVGDARFHADPVAHGQARNARPGFHDHARRLVPQHHGRRDHEGADPTVRVVMHVAAADAHGIHRNAHRARSGCHGKVDIAQRQPTDTFENERACHGMPCPVRPRRLTEMPGRAPLIHSYLDCYKCKNLPSRVVPIRPIRPRQAPPVPSLRPSRAYRRSPPAAPHGSRAPCARHRRRGSRWGLRADRRATGPPGGG